VLRAFSEVQASAETLLAIATLARRAPHKNLAVGPEAQLRLFLEAYLQEVYILSLRCGTMLTLIQRAYRKDARGDRVAATLVELRDGMTSSFKVMPHARGAHVHEFRHDDLTFHGLVLSSSSPRRTLIRCDTRELDAAQ
jgi:hypothetical protein